MIDLDVTFSYNCCSYYSGLHLRSFRSTCEPLHDLGIFLCVAQQHSYKGVLISDQEQALHQVLRFGDHIDQPS